MSETLKKLNLPAFAPLPFLDGAWAQTIAGRYWPQRPPLRATAKHVIELADGDKLAALENAPYDWQDGQRVVVMVHGLSGSSHSSYMTRISRSLCERGYLALRINLRGCGEGFGLAERPYHSGRSEDVREVIEWVGRRYPKSPVTLLGFSLGANISLKLSGEDGNSPTAKLDSVVAVSPPIDLAACAEHLKRPENRFFDQFFVSELRREIKRHHKRFPHLKAPDLPKRITLNQFDDLYTAPRSGFANAADYYSKSSSGQFVPKIEIPALILCANDDPIIDARAYLKIPHRPNVDIVLTERGGHVGFLGPSGSGPLNFRWMDRLVLEWIARL